MCRIEVPGLALLEDEGRIHSCAEPFHGTADGRRTKKETNMIRILSLMIGLVVLAVPPTFAHQKKVDGQLCTSKADCIF